jgi:hypothetical protein
MIIPSISMRKFFNLNIKPNFFSQESGMLFWLSSLEIPDLIDCFANQKKNNKTTATLHAMMRNKSIIEIYIFAKLVIKNNINMNLHTSFVLLGYLHLKIKSKNEYLQN